MSIKVTFLQRSTGRTPGRAQRRKASQRHALRSRRNRKRSAPPWRRVPALIAALRGEDGALRRIAPTLLIAGTLVLLAYGLTAGYRFVTTSDSFAIHVIEVRGNHVLSEDVVRARLGISQGDNIFLAEIATMTDALEADPWVAHASVRRELPHTLIVEIDEHQPAALVELDGLYLANRAGHVFKRAQIEREEGAGLTIITGLSRDDYAEDSERIHQAIRDALELVELYQAHPSRPALGEVHIHPRHGVSLLTYDSAMAVRLGHGAPAALSRRLSRFDVAWRSLAPDERSRARIIHADDASRSDRVTVGFEEIE